MKIREDQELNVYQIVITDRTFKGRNVKFPEIMGLFDEILNIAESKIPKSIQNSQL